MKKNRNKLSLLAFMLVFLSINLSVATKAFAENSNKNANLCTGSSLIEQGTGGFCICPHCGEKQAHKAGIPCQSVNCSKCNSAMARDLQKETDTKETTEKRFRQNTQKNTRFSMGQRTGDSCICPHCGKKQTHKADIPCQSVDCSKCNSAMVRALQKNPDTKGATENGFRQNAKKNTKFPLEQGPDGFCTCPYCGEKQAHNAGIPCQSIDCSKCNAAMIRD
jgi:hypothetical protein